MHNNSHKFKKIGKTSSYKDCALILTLILFNIRRLSEYQQRLYAIKRKFQALSNRINKIFKYNATIILSFHLDLRILYLIAKLYNTTENQQELRGLLQQAYLLLSFMAQETLNSSAYELNISSIFSYSGYIFLCVLLPMCSLASSALSHGDLENFFLDLYWCLFSASHCFGIRLAVANKYTVTLYPWKNLYWSSYTFILATLKGISILWSLYLEDYLHNIMTSA